MDDDCEPLSDAMEQLQGALKRLPAPPAALVSCHLSPQGQPVGTAAGHFDWNRCRLILLSAEECDCGIRPVDTVSSSGMFLNLHVVDQVGFPDSRLFYLEDPDFSRRLARVAPLLHVGSSRIVRKLGDYDWLQKHRGYWRAPTEGFWRAFYGFRNNLHFYFEARPGAGTMALWSYRYLHALAGILLLDDHKWWRAKLMTRAFWDGWRGHLGKTLDPELMPPRTAAQKPPCTAVPDRPAPVEKPHLALCTRQRGV